MMNSKNTITETSTSNNQDLLDLLGLGGDDVIPTSTISPAPLGILNGNDLTGLNVSSAPAPMVGMGTMGTIGGDLSITSTPALGDITIPSQPTHMVSAMSYMKTFHLFNVILAIRWSEVNSAR